MHYASPTNIHTASAHLTQIFAKPLSERFKSLFKEFGRGEKKKPFYQIYDSVNTVDDLQKLLLVIK